MAVEIDIGGNNLFDKLKKIIQISYRVRRNKNQTEDEETTSTKQDA